MSNARERCDAFGPRTAYLVRLLLLIALGLTSCSMDWVEFAPSGMSIYSIRPQRISSADGAEIMILGNDLFEVISGGGFPNRLTVEVCGKRVSNVRVDGYRKEVIPPLGKSATIRVGTRLRGRLSSTSVQPVGHVVITGPDGQSWMLPGAVECYDPTPIVTSFEERESVIATNQTTFAWSVRSPDHHELTCTFDPGDDTEPYVVERCLGNATIEHVYVESGTYTASLEIEDTHGRTRRERLSVTARGLPRTRAFPRPLRTENAVLAQATKAPGSARMMQAFGVGLAIGWNPILPHPAVGVSEAEWNAALAAILGEGREVGLGSRAERVRLEVGEVRQAEPLPLAVPVATVALLPSSK